MNNANWVSPGLAFAWAAMMGMAKTFKLILLMAILADPRAFAADESGYSMTPPSTEIMGNSEDIRQSDIQGNSSSIHQQVGPAQKPILIQPGVSPPKPLPQPPKRPVMPPSFRKGCGGYPICDPFYQEFKACEPTCEPIGYHSRRNDPGSCHHTGRAIDVFGMKCSDTGKTYYAINNGRYQEMVKCVKKRRRLKVIWHNGPGRTSGHRDHAHFSVTCNGGGHW